MKPLVLVIEDNQVAADKLCGALSSLYDFHHTKQLADAICFIRTRTPDVILLDLHLPCTHCEASGGCFQTIHRLCPSTPIVLCVSHEEDLKEAERLVDTVVPKEDITVEHMEKILQQAVITHKIKAIYMPLTSALQRIGQIVETLSGNSGKVHGH
jgi:CheY-like chemotaxis protein